MGPKLYSMEVPIYLFDCPIEIPWKGRSNHNVVLHILFNTKFFLNKIGSLNDFSNSHWNGSWKKSGIEASNNISDEYFMLFFNA
jgi:hypothetical protein